MSSKLSTLTPFLRRTFGEPRWSLASLIPAEHTALPELPLAAKKIEELSGCRVEQWEQDARKMLWFAQMLPSVNQSYADRHAQEKKGQEKEDAERRKTERQEIPASCSWFPQAEGTEKSVKRNNESGPNCCIIDGFDDGIGNRKVVHLTMDMLEDRDPSEQAMEDQRRDLITENVTEYINSYRGDHKATQNSQ